MLQEGEVHKLGANTPVKVDVRVIAATHRDLSAMVEDGTFREDLYYRLAVVPLRIPALRERREDIPELIDTLFQRAKERHGLLDVRMASAVHQRLIAYRWPGNVRQLENVLERLLVLSSADLITVEDLPEELIPPPRARPSSGLTCRKTVSAWRRLNAISSAVLWRSSMEIRPRRRATWISAAAR